MGRGSCYSRVHKCFPFSITKTPTRSLLLFNDNSYCNFETLLTLFESPCACFVQYTDCSVRWTALFTATKIYVLSITSTPFPPSRSCFLYDHLIGFLKSFLQMRRLSEPGPNNRINIQVFRNHDAHANEHYRDDRTPHTLIGKSNAVPPQPCIDHPCHYTGVCSLRLR